MGLLLAFFSGGAIGGYWLGIGRRATWGYASGFLVGGIFISQMFTYLRFLSAGQGPGGAISYCTAMGAMGFGTAGCMGGLSIGSSRKLVVRSTAGFTLGGVLLAGSFLIPYPGSPLVEQLVTMTLTLTGFLIPHLVGGGTAVGSALESEAGQDKIE